MKLIYFHQHFSTPKGGTGTRSYEFAKKLIEQGHDVTMVCGSFDVGNTGLSQPFINGRRQGVVDNIKVVEYELHYSNNLSFIERLKQFLLFSIKCCREVHLVQPKIVFCTSTPLTVSIPGMYAKFIKRLPFVFEVRDLWPELPKAMGVITNPIILALMKALEVISYKMSDHVIALSEGMANGVRKHVPSNKVTVISNGCDVYLANSSEQVSATLPRGVSEEDFIAIYGGTIGLANGVDAALDVAEKLIEKSADHIKLLIVGNGMLKQQLQDDAKHRGLNNIIFIDNAPKLELFSLYKQSHVGMMLLKDIPAFYDGTSPNKFFDYLSVGLPVICNYSGWINSLIVEEGIGRVVPAGNSEQFANALIEMSIEKKDMKTCAMNAKKLALDKFSREELSSKFVKILEKFK